MLEKRMSTFYLLLVDEGELNADFTLLKNEIRLPHVLIALKVIIFHNTYNIDSKHEYGTVRNV